MYKENILYFSNYFDIFKVLRRLREIGLFFKTNNCYYIFDWSSTLSRDIADNPDAPCSGYIQDLQVWAEDYLC